jgi:superfamily I DNA/RNA helicase
LAISFSSSSSFQIVTLNLNHLNEKQREAVLHGKNPLLILAGAGSGKTSTMAYRIAHLIAARNVPASNILGLSFTRKAAQELKERVIGLVVQSSGPLATNGLTISTFHSFCVRILRANAEKLGFQKNFTILNQNDQVDLVRQILRHIKVDERRFDPNTLLFKIGQTKNRFMSPQQAEEFFLESSKLASDYAAVTASVYPRYREQLKLLDAMDFDDLLFNAVKLLKKHTTVREHYNQRFTYILVDEYQDTNPAQFRLLRLLTEKHQNICVVGDDDQSIYAWRGADSTHILEFGKHYHGSRTITLDQNYRSTTTILDAANGIITKNKNRHPKALWSDRGSGDLIQQIIAEEDRGEAEIVAEEILKLAQMNKAGQVKQIRPWKDFAILYRSNTQSRLFEEALRMRRIPYKLVGALSFLDRKEVKDVLSYWRLIMNPKDDASARRILNWPSRGLGKSTLEAINTHALEKSASFFEALGETARLAPRGAAGAASFCELITGLRGELERATLGTEALSAWGRHSLEKIQVKRALEEDSDDPVQAARKWENIDELINSLGQLNISEVLAQEPGANGITLLREYLSLMTLNALYENKNSEEEKDSKDQVTLLTLHGSKGLEYPVVFLVGMEEGLLPHRRTIEEATDFSEERRLCYVGITRAKQHLILTRAKNRIRYGKAVPRTPSRFLDEIPTHIPLISHPKKHEKNTRLK